MTNTRPNKAKCGQNLTGEAVDAYVAMYVLKDALERITIWPKSARRAGYTPVFPMPNK